VLMEIVDFTRFYGIWQQNDWFASECAPLCMVRLLYELSVPACELFTRGLRVSIDHLPSELE